MTEMRRKIHSSIQWAFFISSRFIPLVYLLFILLSRSFLILFLTPFFLSFLPITRCDCDLMITFVLQASSFLFSLSLYCIHMPHPPLFYHHFLLYFHLILHFASSPSWKRDFIVLPLWKIWLWMERSMDERRKRIVFFPFLSFVSPLFILILMMLLMPVTMQSLPFSSSFFFRFFCCRTVLDCH